MPLLRPRVVREDEHVSGRRPVAATDEDKPLQAVLKWIPIEVIAFYQAIMASVPVEKTGFRLWATAAAVPICAGWIAFATKPDDHQGYAQRQIILAALAFVFWAAAVQSEVLHSTFTWWETWMGSAVLIFGSILLPIFDGILKKLGLTQMA